MNIFFLDRCPFTAARHQHDKHVVKMCLETAQILCTVGHSVSAQVPYKPTHAKHPSVLWAGANCHNFEWLVDHGLGLCDEYTHRYNKVHACQRVIDGLQHVGRLLPFTLWTDPPQCMPPEYQCPNDPVLAYRTYYIQCKVNQSKWTNREPPYFVIDALASRTGFKSMV